MTDGLQQSEPTRIILIRHGETAWNSEKRIQGQIDIDLNAVGVEQAEAAACRLATLPFAALYSSDLLRARHTAERIGALLEMAPLLLPEFRERRYGCFEGLTYEDAERDYPADYAAFEARIPDYAFPAGGESLLQFHARVTAGLGELARRHGGQRIAIVTHGGVLDIVNRFVRGNPLQAARDFLIPNAGLNWVALEDGRWSLTSWGETGHLAASARDELRHA